MNDMLAIGSVHDMSAISISSPLGQLRLMVFFIIAYIQYDYLKFVSN